MTEFFKLSGSGNDFVALVEPAQEVGPEVLRAWCRRGVSLGADGVFVLRRAPAGVAMDYFNADGLPADLCLNGTRCAAQLAFHLGWGEDRLEVRTGAGSIVARARGRDVVALEIPLAGVEPKPHTVPIDGASHAGFQVRVGVPHFVLPWSGSFGTAPVRTLGAALRHHPHFAPAGTNVNFVQYPSRHRAAVRTYERGVEDETLSCGSGVVASVAAGIAAGVLDLPVEVETQGGFLLRLEAGTESETWSLSGDARVVARGELLPEAVISPRPPFWLTPS